MALSDGSTFEVLFANAQRSASQSAEGGEVAEFDGRMVVVDVTAYTDGEHTFTLMVSDDGADWSEADSKIADSLTVDAAGDVGTHYLDYTGSDPYLGLKCDTAGTTDGATWGAYLIASDASKYPAR